MPNPTRRWLLAAGVTLALTTLLPLAQAQADYPNKPIRLVVPYPPGGGNDDVARLLAARVEKSIGQPIVVENRAGASGMIAGDFVARAAPDGYTIMIDHSGIVINPALFPSVSFDVERDLAPITQAVAQGSMLLVHPDLPAKSVAELIALARAQPGKLNYASPGNGTPQHIGMELFNDLAGVRITHIPYKGGAPATTALVSGEVQMLLSGTTGLPFVQSGKARVLATTGQARSSALPETPTVAESGLPGFQSVIWLGFFAPARTPAPIIDRLNREFLKALALPELRAQLAARNFEVVGSSPAQFARLIHDDRAMYAQIVRKSGIKAD